MYSVVLNLLYSKDIYIYIYILLYVLFHYGLSQDMNIVLYATQWGFPGGRVVKNLPANAGDTRDMGLIPGSERSLGVGNGNLLQYSCLENSMDRGAWWATVHGAAKSQT